MSTDYDTLFNIFEMAEVLLDAAAGKLVLEAYNEADVIQYIVFEFNDDQELVAVRTEGAY